MSEINYFRLIEAYFEGKISPTDQALLDAKISSDPLVRAEFNLQQSIITGITNARKQQLKSRLASIDLPTQTGVLAGSGIKWLAGTVAGVTLFGSMLYWSLTSFDDKIKRLDLKIDQELVFNDNHLADFPELIEEKGTATEDKKIENKASKVPVSMEEHEDQKEKIDATAKVQPQALMSYQDDVLFKHHKEEELENISSRDIAHNRVDKTEIEFYKSIEEQDSFHYRYFNSKLYLYGDFKEMPYQIIELNDKGKKQLFLSHNEEVYFIKDKTTEISELKEVQDQLLKMEIQLIVEE